MLKSLNRSLRVVSLSLACVLVATFTAPARAADVKPNVLFIAIDDLNDWVGVLDGHPQAHTPNIDRLAKRGVLFTRAYCAAPACNPSRAALMTGILPSTSGVYLNPNPWRQSPVLKNAVTIPQHFMAHGYRAIGSGKIYHGAYPDPASWDNYWPAKNQQRPPDPSPPNKPLNTLPNTRHFDWGPIDAKDADMGDVQVADWVIGKLTQEINKPTFLACGFYRPHLPWFVPRKYFNDLPLDGVQLPKVLKNDLDDVPPAGVKMARPQGDHARVTKANQWHRAVQAYLASVRFTDAQVGRVLDGLDASGKADHTIIVLWTDHGWNLGEKQHWRKFALWENTTRTPMIWVVPKGLSDKLVAGTKPGTRVDTPVSLTDIYPTLIDLCGLKPNKALQGQSLTPLLADANAKWDRPALTTHGRNNHALRSKHFRYIRYADGSEELYDHRNDPEEWTNVAGVAKYAKVKRELAKWLPKDNVPVMVKEKKSDKKVKKNNKKKTESGAKP